MSVIQLTKCNGCAKVELEGSPGEILICPWCREAPKILHKVRRRMTSKLESKYATRIAPPAPQEEDYWLKKSRRLASTYVRRDCFCWTPTTQCDPDGRRMMEVWNYVPRKAAKYGEY